MGPEEVRGNDQTRAAWGTQLDPTDLSWRREQHNFETNNSTRKNIKLIKLIKQKQKQALLLLCITKRQEMVYVGAGLLTPTCH